MCCAWKGLNGYGPMGSALKSRITSLWQTHFVLEGGLLEVDSSILNPQRVPR